MNQPTTLLSGIFVASIVALTMLSGCTDTSGLSAESSRGPHPDSNPSATVTVVEFADLQCPACRAAHFQIVKPLNEQIGDMIRYEFKHFPLQTIHPNALMAAQASECAADQGKFWDFVDLNYENQPDLSRQAVEDWAKQLGLDISLFNRCIESDIKRDTVLADFKEGRELNVPGTPTFFVNGKKVESDAQALAVAIKEALSGSLMPL
ncbi:MAG: DsbA family protein [Candidatus Peregrinibacteria bacterium]|nr:DsbA family protein [Candidatus Peregrinibacteria bacterium]